MSGRVPQARRRDEGMFTRERICGKWELTLFCKASIFMSYMPKTCTHPGEFAQDLIVLAG
jgi:hypothetical protein